MLVVGPAASVSMNHRRTSSRGSVPYSSVLPNYSEYHTSDAPNYFDLSGTSGRRSTLHLRASPCYHRTPRFALVPDLLDQVDVVPDEVKCSAHPYDGNDYGEHIVTTKSNASPSSRSPNLVVPVSPELFFHSDQQLLSQWELRLGFLGNVDNRFRIKDSAEASGSSPLRSSISEENHVSLEVVQAPDRPTVFE